MDDACGVKAAVQSRAGVSEPLRLLVNMPVFVQAPPESVRSASGPKHTGPLR